MKQKIRIATLGITEEFRKMKLGEVVRFPCDKYKYNSIRSTPSTSLVNEMMEGKRWKTKLNFEDKCVEVTRIA
ncbi:MAG: hypothetical protein HDS66_07150 [Bacteroidales bacterium]|nr:hypothetical protein [Bacteroidales bacterium]